MAIIAINSIITKDTININNTMCRDTIIKNLEVTIYNQDIMVIIDIYINE